MQEAIWSPEPTWKMPRFYVSTSSEESAHMAWTGHGVRTRLRYPPLTPPRHESSDSKIRDSSTVCCSPPTHWCPVPPQRFADGVLSPNSVSQRLPTLSPDGVLSPNPAPQLQRYAVPQPNSILPPLQAYATLPLSVTPPQTAPLFYCVPPGSPPVKSIPPHS